MVAKICRHCGELIEDHPSNAGELEGEAHWECMREAGELEVIGTLRMDPERPGELTGNIRLPGK